MGILNKAADLVQKGTVLGLVSLLGYQVYQIGYNVNEYKHEKQDEQKNQHKVIMEKIEIAIEEDSKDNNSIDKIPDRYDPDDNSYLKKVPKLSK